jgi:hypothetical protein
MRQKVTVGDEDQMLDLGRQARLAGFPLSACNMKQFDARRAFWVAGWVDTDNEMKPMEGQNDDLCDSFDGASSDLRK